jgi:putative holliday junction resolvase
VSQDQSTKIQTPKAPQLHFDRVEDFAPLLPPMRAIAGLDFGEKTIGFAVSDLLRVVATPLLTIKRVKFTDDAARLLELIALVLGLPRNMDGSEGPRAQATRAFARNLSRLTPLPICFWDERLSTVAAERALIEADMSRLRRKQLIDHVAAGYILQGVLDRMAHMAKAAGGVHD